MDQRKKEGGHEKETGQTERMEASGIMCGSKSGKGSEGNHLESTEAKHETEQ